MNTTIHLAVFDTLADWEVGHLTAHLRNGQFQRPGADWEVRTVGLTREAVTTMGGLRVLPDLALDDLDPAASALLVLPGGATWESGALTRFVDHARAFLDAGSPVAAACGATFALAAGGLLDDRAHTSNHPGYLASSGYAGTALYRAEPVVVDRGLVTATGIAPVHFARAVFELLGSHDRDVLDSWHKLYADQDPAGYAELTAGRA